MKLSLVYPAYNEAENLPRLLPETARIAEGLFPDYEVVLADDGSTDGSSPLVDRLAAESPRVRAVHHRRNRGLGAAIRTGLATATGDLVLYMDSDFPVATEEARAALSQWTPETDMLIGYRLGRAEGPWRELMSWSYNRLMRWGFGLRVRDVNFAFKLLRRPLLESMRLRSEGSFIDAEMLLEAKRLGARLREVGLRYHPRVAGASTAASGRVVMRILKEAWQHRRRAGRLEAEVPRVVINADDFGLCEAVNDGVAEAFDRGVVTSASILPAGEAFAHAVSLARARPDLDMGVHLSLVGMRPVSSPDRIPSLVGEDGRLLPSWREFLARQVRGAVRTEELAAELQAQVERARSAGLTLSHLDSHQHLHVLPGVLPIVVQLAGAHGIGAVRCPWQRTASPTRGRSGSLRRRAQGAALRAASRMAGRVLRGNGLLVADDFRGFDEAGQWDATRLAQAVGGLDGGLTEICCHPAVDDGVGERFPWGYRWQQELDALASREVAAAIRMSGVKLTSFRECLVPARQSGGAEAR